MRILIVGAGATGGAFGARLIEAGRDVTFLVRAGRAKQLEASGLVFHAPDGARTYRLRAVTALEPGEPYDLVIVALKAPALPGALATMAPAIGPGTAILPLLNGMDHIDELERAYPGHVVGGLVKIVATVGPDGAVHQMTPLCTMTIGALDGGRLDPAVVDALTVEGITLSVDPDIRTRLWEKWVFIAAAGIITCLFRGNIGDILAAGGEGHILQAIAETEDVASRAGHPVGEASHAQSLELLTAPGSEFTSSLYRDLQHGEPAEAEHILGGLAARARILGVPTPLLDATLLQLRTHRQASARATAGASPAQP